MRVDPSKRFLFGGTAMYFLRYHYSWGKIGVGFFGGGGVGKFFLKFFFTLMQ